jgi:uncharacterized damage-inducible protein DinB
MLAEFDHEMANTRKVLERIPEDKLEWKPDPKSMALGRLAGHITEMPGWASVTLATDSLDLGTGDFKPLFATSRAQILKEFDKNIAESRAALASATDENMMRNWQLRMGDQLIMEMPKVGIIRTMVMSHTIHHRAQMGVYLRLNGVPVPAIYGPSADETLAATA